MNARAASILSRFVVTIDGPAGSGKSTTARGVARALGLVHLDTGAMYRAVTLAALRAGIAPDDGGALERLAGRLGVELDAGVGRVCLDGEDVTEAIREPEVTRHVSAVSAHAGVRREMVRRQRRHAFEGGVVLEGRDTGSVVVPWADVRVFLVADVRARAARRAAELRARGHAVDVDAVAADLERRDGLDRSRKVGPLVEPAGAVRVDTSRCTIEEQVAAVVEAARAAADHVAGLHAPVTGPDDPRVRRRYYAAGQWLVRALGRVAFGLRVVTPMDPTLRENYIFAPNHVSNVDPFMAGCTLRREVHYMAKHTLFGVPVLGAILRSVHAFPIRRGGFDRGAMARAEALLRQGRSLMIFPEGTRQRHGGLGRARSGVGILALRTGVPVIPMYVHGSLHLGRAALRRPRIVVVHGPAIRLAPGWRLPEDSSEAQALYRRHAHSVLCAVAALRERLLGS